MNWREACHYAGTSTKIRRALEALGRKCGAKPSDWQAIATNVPLAEVRLQRFDGANWLNMAASEVPAKTLFDYRVRITSKERVGGREFIIAAENFDKAHDAAYKQACETARALNINVQLEITEA